MNVKKKAKKKRAGLTSRLRYSILAFGVPVSYEKEERGLREFRFHLFPLSIETLQAYTYNAPLSLFYPGSETPGPGKENPGHPAAGFFQQAPEDEAKN